MDVMKGLALLLSCSAALAGGAELADVHTVYVLKMSKGMDQYLASHLTREHVFQVVTDPKLAEAVLTDHLGESFETKLEELFPALNPEPVQHERAPEKDHKDQTGKPSLLADPVNKLADPASSGTFGKANGMVFLVSARSRQVIWSAYDLPKDATSKQLDRTASDIVNRIKRDLNPKK